RAAVGIVGGPKFAVMRGNDAAADRKTQPQSLLFCGEERLEYLFHFFLRDTAAPIGDGHNDCAPTVLDSSTNEQPSLGCIAIRHRLTTVHHQVDQNLLKLHRVASNSGQISRQFGIDTDVLTDEI